MALTPVNSAIPRKRGRPKGTYRVLRPSLDKWSAAQVLASADERKLWARVLDSEDDRIVLDALKFLVVMRDGKPVQQINVNSTNVNISIEDIAKARLIARSLMPEPYAEPYGSIDSSESKSLLGNK
jgi:hypothetical protein